MAHTESASEIIALLQGLGKGVGQKTAELIVECYGKKTLDVLDLPPKEAVRKLREIKGIGATKAKHIKELWDNNAARQVRREGGAWGSVGGVDVGLLQGVRWGVGGPAGEGQRVGPKATGCVQDAPTMPYAAVSAVSVQPFVRSMVCLIV